MITIRSVHKAILLAMGLPLVFCFDQAVARRAYSTAEAEIGRYGGAMPEQQAPVKRRRHLKKRIVKLLRPRPANAPLTLREAAAIPAMTAVTAGPASTNVPAVNTSTAAVTQSKPDFFAEAAKRDPKAAAALAELDKQIKVTAVGNKPGALSTTDTSSLSQAKNLTESGQYAAAIKVCDELLKSNPASAGVILQKAEILVRSKNYSQARQLVAQVMQDRLIADRSSMDLSQLALVYHLMEEDAQAAATIQEALKIAPLDNAIMVRASDYLGANGQYEQAVQVTQEIFNQRKDSALAHALAMMQARAGHIGDALATIARQFDNSNSAAMLEVQAEAYIAAGEYGKALAVYTGLAREHREEVFYPSSKAEMLRRLSRFDEALAECNAALQLTSQDPWLLSCKVKILQELKQFEAAHKTVKELIAISPNDPLNYIASAAVYEAQRDFSSALIACDEGLRRLGQSDELKEQRIRELWNLGRIDGAVSELDKLLAQEPGNDQFKRLKVRLETYRGNYDQAQKIAQSLTASSGNTVATGLCLAELSFAQKEYKQALALLDAALKQTALNDVQRTPMQLLAVASCMLSGDNSIALERLDEYYRAADSSVEGGWPCPLLQVMMGRISMPMVISKTSNVDRFATISFFEAIRLLAKGDNVHATRMFAQAAKEARSDSMEAVAGSALQQSGLSSQMINMLMLALGSVGALALLAGLIVMVRRSIAKRAAQPKGEPDPQGFLQEADKTRVWTPNEVAESKKVGQAPSSAAPDLQENTRVSAIGEQLPNANELSPDSSGARRKYFASFSGDAQVEDIWNQRISNLDAGGNPLRQMYELKDDMVSYGASLPPIIPGVIAAGTPVFNGPKDAPLNESELKDSASLVDSPSLVDSASLKDSDSLKNSASLTDSASHQLGQDELDKN